MRLKTIANNTAFAIYGWLVKRPLELFQLLRHKELYRHESYFPEKPHKSSRKIFCEQVRQILKYKTPNAFYFPYGCDVKSKQECDEYVNYWFFRDRRESLNFSNKVNCTCILRDKVLFNIFANGIGIATAENEFYVAEREVRNFKTKEHVSIDELCKNDHELFCKLVDGECGNGIFQLTIKTGKVFINGKESTQDELHTMLSKGRYLAQTMIRQHPLMSGLHPSSINTIRLITVRGLKDGKIQPFPSILRIGTGNSIVDNTSQGGLAVGIDLKTGRLKQYGFYKPQFGLKVNCHPDSGIQFDQFVIPYFKEAIKQAVYFHSMLPGMHSVGWDIAIGKNGPIFIEGNDNWEINGPQICNGGLRKEFNELFYK